MAGLSKDTIYIDVDDEITAIIDKVRASEGKVVALVLPKRASVLQSIVNMKLLKRSADTSKKHIVLITSEAGLMPLAGAAGVHVAKTLQSRPVIPEGPAAVNESENVDEVIEAPQDSFELSKVSGKSIGELAGAAGLSSIIGKGSATAAAEGEGAAASAAGAAATKASTGTPSAKPDKKLSIPNFNKFRTKLMVGGAALVLLLIGWYWASFVAPQAVVAIDTDSSTVDNNFTLTLATAATKVDVEAETIPAKLKQVQKTSSQEVLATGEVNKGERAKGFVTLSITSCDVEEVRIPSGTGVSSNGQTFITQSSATLQSVEVAGKCQNGSFKNLSTKRVDVIAQKPGASYNVPAGSSFTVAGYNEVKGQTEDGVSGGTDQVVKIVTQADIDGAKQKLGEQNTQEAKRELQEVLEAEGLIPFADTFKAGEPTVTTTANVGDEVEKVTVTGATPYTMLGAERGDLEELVEASVEKEIDTSKQSILDLGIDDAAIRLLDNQDPNNAQLAYEVTSTAGPEIDIEDLKEKIAGMKPNDVEELLTSSPDVTEVTVELSPFWVSAVPSNPEKITIDIAKPTPVSNDDEN